MEEIPHVLQKEIVEGILLKDAYFFKSRSIEFNIFRYTSIFSVFAFSIQIVLGILQYFKINGSFTNTQFISFLFSVLALTILIMLYTGFSYVVYKAASTKKVYLKNYSCNLCGYSSFSDSASIIHVMSNKSHSLKEQTFMLKRFKSIAKMSRFNYDSWHYKPEEWRKVNNQNSFGEEITNSLERVKIKSKPDYSYFAGYLITSLIVMGIMVLFDEIEHFSFLNFIVIVISLTVIMIIASIVSLKIAKEDVMEDDDIFCYLIIMRMDQLKSTTTSMINFKLLSLGRSYFENTRKGYSDISISSPGGPIYIVDKVIWNKYGDIIEINPTEI